MENLPAIMTLAHAIAAVVWVGGMVFAHQVLRPAMGFLEPPQRLTLWAAVFRRFFIAVWVAIAVLLATGYHMVFAEYEGFDQAGLYIHLMHGNGLLMTALFVFLFFVPYPRYRAFVAAGDWRDAAAQLNLIRRIVGVNMVLGIINIAVGSSGRLWG